MPRKIILLLSLSLFIALPAFGAESFREAGKEVKQEFKKVGRETARVAKKSGKLIGKEFREAGKEIRKSFKGEKDKGPVK